MVSADVNLGIGNPRSSLFRRLKVHESIEEADGNLCLSFFRVHERLLRRVADESYLGKNGRHRSLIENEKLRLFDSTVDGFEILLVLILDSLGKIQALLKESILKEGKDNGVLG